MDVLKLIGAIILAPVAVLVLVVLSWLNRDDERECPSGGLRHE